MLYTAAADQSGGIFYGTAADVFGIPESFAKPETSAQMQKSCNKYYTMFLWGCKGFFCILCNNGGGILKIPELKGGKRCAFSSDFIHCAWGAQGPSASRALVNPRRLRDSVPLETLLLAEGGHTRAVLRWSDLSLSSGTLSFPDKLSLRRMAGGEGISLRCFLFLIYYFLSIILGTPCRSKLSQPNKHPHISIMDSWYAPLAQRIHLLLSRGLTPLLGLMCSFPSRHSR